MTVPTAIHPPKKNINALDDQKTKRQIRYSRKAEERRVQQDAIIKEAFLRDYPNWEEKKNSFSPKERVIIELSYGLDEKNGNKVFSLAQIGVILGKEKGFLPISRQRVQQIKNRVINRLTQDLENN
jgi:DNA-directed RNA polymerase sigma subunit (sigma70/sigma32)